MFWWNEAGVPFIAQFPLFGSHDRLLAAQESVLDFGCGCGRLAIQMLMQHDRPRNYLGVDVSRKMIEWCQENLTPYDGHFRFQHHDVFSPVYAPDNSRNATAPIPAADGSVSLSIAHSVFTHLFQHQAEHYLTELSRVAAPGGLLYSTWFFCNREAFYVLAPHQNCLFVNEHDASQAVYYDWNFFKRLVRERGLKIAWVDWTVASGFHTGVFLQKDGEYPDIGDRLVPPRSVVGF